MFKKELKRDMYLIYGLSQVPSYVHNGPGGLQAALCLKGDAEEFRSHRI